MKYLFMFMIMLMIMLISACAQFGTKEVPKGSESQLLTVKTKPTKAAIYKDGQYIGHSPQKIWLWHGAPRINQIVAVPLHEHQFIQIQSLRIPTIPTQLTFYMTEPSHYEYDFSDKPSQSKLAQQPSHRLKRLQLFFDFDQDQLNISEIKRLTLWLNQLDSEPERIEVHAYADEVGSQEYNKALSHRRALAITLCLQRLAIKPSELLVIHHGERVSVTQTQQLPKRIDRLVELLVFYRDDDTGEGTGDNKKAPGLQNPGASNH